MKEIFKDIPNYEGLYQVSNKGRVKSYCKRTATWNLRKLSKNSKGYMRVGLSIKGKQKGYGVHQLVAITFLNHTPIGHTMVVDHINRKKTDNRVSNLQVITQRENISKDKKTKKSSSKYTGVSWNKVVEKWGSQIVINGKLKLLGYFDSEAKASEAYKAKLASLGEDKLTIEERKELVFKRKEAKRLKEEAALQAYFDSVDKQLKEINNQ